MLDRPSLSIKVGSGKDSILIKDDSSLHLNCCFFSLFWGQEGIFVTVSSPTQKLLITWGGGGGGGGNQGLYSRKVLDLARS